MGTKKKEEKALSFKDFPWLLGFYIMMFIVEAAVMFFFGLLLDIIPHNLLVILFELMKWHWI
ncbi:MAG: hypothetical protein V3V81_00495 [Candidatus Bathyarchaeia archaeon]